MMLELRAICEDIFPGEGKQFTRELIKRSFRQAKERNERKSYLFLFVIGSPKWLSQYVYRPRHSKSGSLRFFFRVSQGSVHKTDICPVIHIESVKLIHFFTSDTKLNGITEERLFYFLWYLEKGLNYALSWPQALHQLIHISDFFRFLSLRIKPASTCPFITKMWNSFILSQVQLSVGLVTPGQRGETRVTVHSPSPQLLIPLEIVYLSDLFLSVSPMFFPKSKYIFQNAYLNCWFHWCEWHRAISSSIHVGMFSAMEKRMENAMARRTGCEETWNNL